MRRFDFFSKSADQLSSGNINFFGKRTAKVSTGKGLLSLQNPDRFKRVATNTIQTMRVVFDRKCVSKPAAAVGRCRQQPTRCHSKGSAMTQIQISHARIRSAFQAQPRAKTLFSAHAYPEELSGATVEGASDQAHLSTYILDGFTPSLCSTVASVEHGIVGCTISESYCKLLKNTVQSRHAI